MRDRSRRLATIGLRHYWQADDYPVKILRFPEHGALAPHGHVFHEIAYVEAGTALHVTVEGLRRVHPGDVIVLPPGVWHGYQAANSLSVINCIFDGSLLRHFSQLFLLMPRAFQLFRCRSREPARTPPVVLHARPAQRLRLAHLLEDVRREIAEQPSDWRARVAIQLLDLLSSIARLEKESPPVKIPLANRAAEAVIEVVDYLESHYPEAIQFAELARRAHLSPAYLSRSFNRHMGMGIFQYLHHIRIEQACRLLRYGKDPIGIVANEVGYGDQAYFANCFRRQTGLTPRQYRHAGGAREKKPGCATKLLVNGRPKKVWHSRPRL